MNGGNGGDVGMELYTVSETDICNMKTSMVFWTESKLSANSRFALSKF